MIYENDNSLSETKLTKLRKDTLDAFPQFTRQKFVILKYEPSLIAPSRDNPGMVDQPQAVILRCVQNVNTPDGAKQYRYAVSSVSKGKGEIHYEPSAISIDRQIIIEDLDLLVFLHNFCPLVVGCINPSSNVIPLLVIEDNEREATLNISRRKNEQIYLDLLFNKLTQKQLTMVANSLNITNSEDFSEDVLRERIDALVRTKATGVEEFLVTANFNNEDDADKLSSITGLKNAVDVGVVVFEKTKREWRLLEPTGDLIKVLQKTNKATPDIPALYAFLVKYDPEMLPAIIAETEARMEAV